jgi:hypothetical protein
MPNDTKPPSGRLSFAGAFLAAVALSGGCSLLLHADATQCTSKTDCTARGPQFVCGSAGICVALTVAEAGPDATAEAGRDTGTDGDTGGGGDVVAVDAGCSSVADCPPGPTTHPEVACDVRTRSCVQLTTDECPFVLPTDYASQSAPPLLVGAFATLPPSGSMTHPSYLNYKLALSEFDIAKGIPAGPGGSADPWGGLRTPVAVICNVEADVPTSMHHLEDLQVPGLVASFDSGTLKTMFTTEALPNSIFVVNAFGANTQLTTLSTNQLLWHMLGQPSDYATAYQAFFPRMEKYVRNLPALNVGSSPIKLAIVTANAIDTQDLYDAATKVIQWNGMTFAQNVTAGNVLTETIDSVLNGKTPPQIDASKVLMDFGTFKPNVVVSFAATEFVTNVLTVYETDLQPSGMYPSNPKPFYLVGPYNMDSLNLLQWIGNTNGAIPEGKRLRVAGIGVASAKDPTQLNAYQSRFLAAGNPSSALGSENYYDAMYFLVYSVVGAGHVANLGGNNLAMGMQRLLGPGPTYNVGPADMGAIFGALGNPNSTITLDGALGPPTFTIATGARVGEGSVYCIQRNNDTAMTPGFDYDVLRLNGVNDAGAPSLSGNFSCYSGNCGDAGTCP